MLIDKSENKENYIHELIVPDKTVETRYVRITNKGELPGLFSIYDLQIFGQGKGSLPCQVNGFKAVRNQAAPRRYQLSWNKVDGANGYIIHWAQKKIALTMQLSYMAKAQTWVFSTLI